MNNIFDQRAAEQEQLREDLRHVASRSVDDFEAKYQETKARVEAAVAAQERNLGKGAFEVLANLEF